MKNYNNKISVIIPIYNLKPYLEESIESVLKQSIGFNDNIEMILVNDGSKDNIEEICLKYKEMYPDNIKYIKQEHKGISAARNKGMSVATGKYINFLDGDDKWDIDAFEKAYNFLEKNKEVDIVCFRQKHFEMNDDYSLFDYIFENQKNKIIDIKDKYTYIQTSVCPAFIRADAIEKLKFDESINVCESDKFLFDIISKKEKIGFISSSNYYSRIRLSQDSVFQTKYNDKDYYFNVFKKTNDYLIKKSKEKYGKIIEYVQYYIANDLLSRVTYDKGIDLSNEEIKEYQKLIKKYLDCIDEKIICEISEDKLAYIIYLLSLKAGKDISNNFKIEKNKIVYKNLKEWSVSNIRVILNTLEVSDGKLKFFALFNNILQKGELYYQLDKKKKKIELYNRHESDIKTFDGNKILEKMGFNLEIPLKDFKRLNFVLKINNEEHNIKIYYHRLCRIQRAAGYYRYKKGIIVPARKRITNIRKLVVPITIKKTFTQFTHLIKKKKYRVIGYKILHAITKPIYKRKRIWLISDRYSVAGDNGEFFFKYVSKNHKNIKSYFILSKDSKDIDRLKQYGKVLYHDTFKYKFLALHATEIVSSQATPYITTPFGDDQIYLSNILRFKFMFIQHGIIMNDLSSWLKFPKQNISLFVTSSKGEYDSIVGGNYLYTKDTVKLTGLPRFDSLVDEAKNKIVFLPTWRSNLVSRIEPGSDKRMYSTTFKDSEYCKFYNKLFSDKKLINALKKHNYTASFYIHPSMSQQIEDFHGNDIITIEAPGQDYQKIFKENNLMITDYSSVSFDFSYMKKPIIYLQFDQEEFFKGQIYEKGYFDYERDGFGPIVTKYDEAINTIIEYIETGCKMKDKYKKRVDKFFAYTDTNNCKRLYDEIMKKDDEVLKN